MNKTLRQLIRESGNVYTGMKADYNKSQYAVWKNKPVLESKQLFALDTLDGLTHQCSGTMDISTERTFNGKPTLHLGGSHNDKDNSVRFISWGGGANMVHFDVGGQDLSKYIRVSMWCYADVKTRPNTWLYFLLCNGDDDMDGAKCMDTRTGFNVPSNEWYECIWEFQMHQRDKVREFVLAMDPQGTPPEDDDRYDLYFSDLRVEVVEPDYVEGWQLDDRIAYSHIGYLNDAPKKAATQNAEGCIFTLRDVNSGKIVYTAPTKTLEMDIGTYQVMDFSNFQTTGEYELEVAGRKSHPFPIGNDVLASPIWKNINFFQRERCGCEVIGLHSVCGLTDFLDHPDGKRRINNAGGWHDAGDLCQELCTTIDAIYAMLDMVEHLGDKDVELRDRVMEEAKHGLDWVVKTGFGDGYYAYGSAHGDWDGPVIGARERSFGGFLRKAMNDARGNWYRSGVQAQGAIVFAESNPRFAEWCRKNAIADFGFALGNEPTEHPLNRGNTATHEQQYFSRKGYAAVMLYRLTGEQKYLDIAAETAQIVMACQQTEYPDWEKPLRGFFWAEREHKNICSYEHQSAEQAPICFLVRLLEAAPEHADAAAWRHACELYAEYIKATAYMIEPFGLLPAAIYNINMEAPSNARGFGKIRFENVDEMFHDGIGNGIKLSDEYYLRRMPISAIALRGFFAPVFAKATAVGELSRLFRDKELRDIALEQIAWMLGKNPFARSHMYGEGYGFQAMYTPYSPDMVGAIPVGIQAYVANDAPYLPCDNHPTFNEVWIHSSSRFLWAMANLVDWL